MADTGETVSVQVTVCNQKGLHARAAAKFVKLASLFDAEINVRKIISPTVAEDVSEYTTVCATSILGLLLLAAECGSKLEISATGMQAETAVSQLAALIESRFEEVE